MASRRQYTTIAEVQEMADVTSTNDAEFEDRISQAEELIDAYIGHQERGMKQTLHGQLTSVSGTTLFDTSDDTHFDRDDNSLTYCVVEIIGGTGAGQQRGIVSSSKNGRSITVASAFSTAPDSTSIYKVYQLGKFPRRVDTYHEPNSLTYYRSIPEAIKRATAAQVQFIIEMGDEYFAGQDSEAQSESIGNYSYSNGGGGNSQSSLVRMLSPKARTLLRGYKNRLGNLEAENPTWL